MKQRAADIMTVAFLLLTDFCCGILKLGVQEREIGGKMTAVEIYKSMDQCMEENKGKEYRAVIPVVRAYAAELGRQVGRTEDDILSFYFKMRKLGK